MPPFRVEEWQLLRAAGQRLTLPCCGARAIPRVSKCGLQHFYHHRVRQLSCDWQPESLEHLYAKASIADACREADYAAITEYRGDGWIADVLAMKGNIKVAFEVQCSRQSYEETVSRQLLLHQSQVRTWWFFKRPPSEDEILLSDADFGGFPEVSAFKLVPFSPLICNDMNFGTIVNDKFYSLGDFVCMLLNQQVQYRSTVSCKSYRAQIGIYERPCWYCRKPMRVCAVQKVIVVGRCGLELSEDTNLRFVDTPMSHQSVIRRFVESDQGSTHGIKATYAPGPYSANMISFRCTSCGYHGPNIWGTGTELVGSADIELPAIDFTHEHWCVSPSKEFCSKLESRKFLSANFL